MKPTIFDVQEPPTEGEIREIRETLGCKLPTEYVAFLQKTNGGMCLPDRVLLSNNRIKGNPSLTYLYTIGKRPGNGFSVLQHTQFFHQDEGFLVQKERALDPFVPPEDYLAIGRDRGGNHFLLGIAGHNFNQVSFCDHSDLLIEPLYDWHNTPCTFANLMDSFCYDAGAINDPFIHRCTAEELRALIESERIPMQDLYGCTLRYRAEEYRRQDLLALFDEIGL